MKPFTISANGWLVNFMMISTQRTRGYYMSSNFDTCSLLRHVCYCLGVLLARLMVATFVVTIASFALASLGREFVEPFLMAPGKLKLFVFSLITGLIITAVAGVVIICIAYVVMKVSEHEWTASIKKDTTASLLWKSFKNRTCSKIVIK